MTLSEIEKSLISDKSNWTEVQSSNIESVLFIKGNRSNGRLFVKFKNNTTYFYEEVPKILVKSMLKSESVGKFFNANIKNNYACYKIV